MKIEQVAIFPSPSQDGVQLLNDMVHYLRTTGIEPEVFNAQTLAQIERHDENGVKITERQLLSILFFAACLECDWVIVDLTRERDGINNFDIIGELPKHFSKVSIVSRNYLPVNMYDVDGKGYPSYTKKKMTNEEILRYVKWRYESDKEQQEPEIERLTYSDFVADQTLYGSFLEKQIELYRKKRRKSFDIFVSFRTKYQDRCDDFPYRYSVNELVGMLNNDQPDICDTDHLVDKRKYGGKINAYCLNEGDLLYSSELLSRFRMWQILSFIDRYYLESCSELWIYGSEDYWDSWWTRGEVFAFYYLFLSVHDKKNPERKKVVKIYDPVRHTIVKELSNEADLLQYFRYDTGKFIQRYARFFSNCNIDSMGMESVKSIQVMRGNIGFLREVISMAKHYDDVVFDNMKQQFLMIRQYPDEFREMLTESAQDDQSRQFIRMILDWNDDEMEQYLHNWNFAMELMRDYSISNPNASQEEIYAYLAERLMGGMSEIITNRGISITDAVKTGMSDEYLKDEIFDNAFYNTLYCVMPSIVSVGFDASHFPDLTEKVILAFFSPSDQAETDVYSPSLAKIDDDDDVLKKRAESRFIDKFEISIRRQKITVFKKDPRYAYMPKRMGGLIDWSEHHDCLEEIPVLCVQKEML
jgi:hypothetical protein